MKDELQIDVDTAWHVFNDLVHELLSNGGRSSFLSAKVRQTPYPNALVHTGE